MRFGRELWGITDLLVAITLVNDKSSKTGSGFVKNWQPSDVLVFIITFLVVFITTMAAFAPYFHIPFIEERAAALRSLFDSLVAIIAMYLGSKINSK